MSNGLAKIAHGKCFNHSLVVKYEKNVSAHYSEYLTFLPNNPPFLPARLIQKVSVSITLLGSVAPLTNQIFRMTSLSYCLFAHTVKQDSIIRRYFIWHVTAVTCSCSAVRHFHSNITEYKQVVIGCCWNCRITYKD